MKLRQNNASKLSEIPKDVFRCILEYQSNELGCRVSKLYYPIKGRQQDRHFPAFEKLDYDNYLVAIN